MTSKFKLGAVLMAALAILVSYTVAPETTAAALPGLFADHGASLGVTVLLLGPVLDVFRGDAFSVIEMTEAINKIPFVPGRAGLLIPWNDRGIATTSIMLEEKEGVLTIINPSPRGGPGTTVSKKKRTARTLTVPHFQRDDAVYADEVQGVREFGQEQQVATVMGVVSGRMSEHTADMDTTLEHQRVGAVKGIVVDGDGNTIYNLFNEFDVTQEGEVDFDLDNAAPASGALRKKCAQTVRTMADNLGGTPISSVHAFCGNAFFDDLIAHPEVVLSYRNTSMAEVLRTGYVLTNGEKIYGAFEFGGIVWENYRGSIGGTAFVDTDKCHLFPLAPQVFRTVYAPADYMETVNTVGLPRYAKQYVMPNDKGIALEMQMNALNYCTRPLALMKGKRT